TVTRRREVRRRMAEDSTAVATDIGETSTPMNALVGAVVTVVTSPALPFAAIVGGALAGYLQGTDIREGVRVGALSGLLAAVPAFVLVWAVVGFFLLGGVHLFNVASLVGAGVFAVVVTYLVGAGALGGGLGAYVRREL
ncbi:MAG: DUF5518 domain-containing protein, partial [Halobacteriaceae archaeon]